MSSAGCKIDNNGRIAVSRADTRNDFGGRGWGIIFLEACLLWISSGSVVHGLNITLPALAAAYHMDPATLLTLATPASWGSIIAAYVGAKVCEGRGSRFLILASLVCGAICFGLMGTFADTPMRFFGLFALVCFFDTNFAYIGGPAMLANWFPRRKSLALGWATMGQTFSTATYVPFVAFCFGAFGVKGGFWGIPVLMAVMFVLVAFFTADVPERLGCTPDNRPMTASEQEASLRAYETNTCPFSTRQLLCMKDVWFMGLSFGGIYIVIVGLLSQFVPRLMGMGYEQDTAILYLVIAALTGVPGAWLWGWISQKFGVRRAGMAYALWYAVAVGLNIFELNQVTMWVSLLMIGDSLGGATNLSMSIVAEKFPRGAFAKAWGIVNPIQSIVRCCAFAILGLGLSYLGSYAGAYAILAVVAVVAFVLIWLTDTSPPAELAEA